MSSDLESQSLAAQSQLLGYASDRSASSVRIRLGVEHQFDSAGLQSASVFDRKGRNLPIASFVPLLNPGRFTPGGAGDIGQSRENDRSEVLSPYVDRVAKRVARPREKQANLKDE